MKTNMYPLLCVSSCMAVLFMALTCGTLLRAGIFLGLRRCFGEETLVRFPEALFALRMLPFLLALLIAGSLALPSFLLLEPKHTAELISPRLILLAAMGAVLPVVAVARAFEVLLTTHRAARRWLRSATHLDMPEISAAVYVVRDAAGLFAVTGMFRSRIFVGRDIFETLSRAEFAAAVQHELAHVEAQDNFRQLIMKMTRPLFFGKLQKSIEGLWSVSAELAADDAALRSGAPALDLASALVRVARLSHCQAAPPVALAASHLVPEDSNSAIALRISRLSARIEDCEPDPRSAQRSFPLFPVTIVAVVLAYSLFLRSLLPTAHKIIEVIVR